MKGTIGLPGLLLREALTTVISRWRRWGLLRTPLYANSIYLMANAAAGAGLTFVFWIVVARVYPVEAVGLGAALISSATLLAFLSTLGLGAVLIRFLPSAGKSSVALINSVFTISGLAAIAVAIVFLAGLPLWSPALSFVRENPSFIAAYIAFITTATLFSLLDEVFIGLRRAQFTLLQNFTLGMLKVTLVVAIASFFQVFGIFASWGLAMALSLGLHLLVVLPRLLPGYRPFPRLRKEIGSEMVRFSSANFVRAGLWYSPSWILPIMVLNLLGAEANAYFYMPWGMASLIFAIPIATSVSLFAEGSHQEEFLGRDVRRSLKLIAGFSLPAVALVLAVGDKLLLIFGEEYSLEGTRLLWVLAPSTLPLAVNAVYMAICQVQKRLKSVILVAAAVAGGTLISSYVLISSLGILGPAVAWLITHTVVALALSPSILKMARSKPAKVLRSTEPQ